MRIKTRAGKKRIKMQTEKGRILNPMSMRMKGRRTRTRTRRKGL